VDDFAGGVGEAQVLGHRTHARRYKERQGHKRVRRARGRDHLEEPTEQPRTDDEDGPKSKGGLGSQLGDGAGVGDALPDFAGPLAGLLAGMTAARTPWVVMVPCDSPFVPADLVARLAAAAAACGAPVAVARSAGREQPVFLLAATHLRDGLADYLAQGRRRIDAWYQPLSAAVVDFPDETAFRNINTLAELQALE
jgi:hypothetical protein